MGPAAPSTEAGLLALPWQRWHTVMGVALCLVWVWYGRFGPDTGLLQSLVAAGFGVLLIAGGVGAPAVVAGLAAASVYSALGGLMQYFGLLVDGSAGFAAAPAGTAFGNLYQRNQFASLMGIGLAVWLTIAAGLLQPARTGLQRGRMPTRVALLALGLLLALSVAASGSRTGVLQWLLVSLMMLAWWRRDGDQGGQGRPALAWGALLLMPLASLVLPWLALWLLGGQPETGLARFDEDAGCGDRRVLWANVLHLIGLQPWWGWGWGELDFAHFITLFPDTRFCTLLDNAHNLPLHLAVTLGIPATVGLGLLLLVWIGRRRPWRETDPVRRMAWCVLAVVGLHSLLEYPLWYGPFQVTVVVMVLLIERGQVVWPWPAEPARRAVRLAASALLLSAVAYVGHDYYRISQLYLAPEARHPAYRYGTLDKARASWLFEPVVTFAAYTTTEVTPEEAQQQFDTGMALLHYSPEPRVIERVLASALYLQRFEEAAMLLARYEAAWPADAARWRERQQLPSPPGAAGAARPGPTASGDRP